MRLASGNLEGKSIWLLQLIEEVRLLLSCLFVVGLRQKSCYTLNNMRCHMLLVY